VAHRPSESVEAPYDKRVSTAQCGVAGDQPWPILACSRNLVAEEMFFPDAMGERGFILAATDDVTDNDITRLQGERFRPSAVPFKMTQLANSLLSGPAHV